MLTYQSFSLTFEPADQPNITAAPEIQKVGLHMMGAKGQPGFGLWFSVDQIPQVEELLNLLWAMKDEQDVTPPLQVVESSDQRAA